MLPASSFPAAGSAWQRANCIQELMVQKSWQLTMALGVVLLLLLTRRLTKFGLSVNFDFKQPCGTLIEVSVRWTRTKASGWAVSREIRNLSPSSHRSNLVRLQAVRRSDHVPPPSFPSLDSGPQQHTKKPGITPCFLEESLPPREPC